MIHINGWDFDFENMVAHDKRDHHKLAHLKTKDLIVRGNGTIGRRYKHELRKFFDPPEECGIMATNCESGSAYACLRDVTYKTITKKICE